MYSVLQQLHTAFATAIREAFGFDADPLVGLSQNAQFGDYQSNAAMGLAKREKSNPHAVAKRIVDKLSLSELADGAPTIAGPGFINVRLNPAWLASHVGEAIATSKVEKPQTVVVDYSGVNIAKEMHVGHLRSTIIGDAIANVLESLGNAVVRRNHLGDWGTQFGMLIQRKLQSGDSAGGIADLENEYRAAKQQYDADPAFAEQARQTVVRLQQGDAAVLAKWEAIVDETRRHYQPVYQRLGVKLDREHERGESFYNKYLADVVRDLKAKNIAIESDGAIAVFIDGPERTPLIIQKSDGGYLYGTTDLAAIRHRVNDEQADRIIYTHDSRQAQHFSQVFRTAEKAGWTRDGAVQLEYAPFGTMLGQDGKPFKTRSGDTVKLKDLLDEAEERAMVIVTEKNADLPESQRQAIARAIGIGAVKYSDLSKDRTSDYIFDWNTMLSFEGNTAPYLQYVYARIQSIFRKAGAWSAGPMLLAAPQELALAKHLLRLNDVIDLVARELKPHLLCTYLYELATKFSSFYENCPVLTREGELRTSRLTICQATATVMARGLDLLGIEHPEQM